MQAQPDYYYPQSVPRNEQNLVTFNTLSLLVNLLFTLATVGLPSEAIS
jgi:hypothetical protein